MINTLLLFSKSMNSEKSSNIVDKQLSEFNSEEFLVREGLNQLDPVDSPEDDSDLYFFKSLEKTSDEKWIKLFDLVSLCFFHRSVNSALHVWNSVFAMISLWIKQLILTSQKVYFDFSWQRFGHLNWRIFRSDKVNFLCFSKTYPFLQRGSMKLDLLYSRPNLKNN